MDEINENLTKETVNVKNVTETVKKNVSEMKSTWGGINSGLDGEDQVTDLEDRGEENAQSEQQT